MIKHMVLIAKRKDGKYLSLDECAATTHESFVDDPVLAKHIPCDYEDLLKPHEATYYFENTYRAREIWLKDCIMVRFEIITTAREVK